MTQRYQQMELPMGAPVSQECEISAVLLDAEGAAEFFSSCDDLVAFDTETCYVPDLPNSVVRVIRGNPNNYPFLFTFSTKDRDVAVELNERTLPLIQAFLENPLIAKIGYNLKYDLHMCYNIGIQPQGVFHDAMIMHHLIDEEDTPPDWNGVDDFKPQRQLKELAVKYLDPDADKYEKSVDISRAALAKERGVPKDQIGYNDVPLDVMVPYACADTRYTYDLFKLWLPQIAEQKLEQVLGIEMATLLACISMERGGYFVDAEYLRRLRASLTLSQEDLIQEIYAIAGKTFNPSSAEELVEVFSSLGAHYVAVTDKGNYQTDEEALEPWLESPIENVAELARLILAWRADDKILGTYVNGILDNISYYTDDRVRCEFAQTFTVTGRMSCSSPNLQNLPRDDKRIRAAFKPSEDCITLFADYDGQEVRIFLHYLDDPELTQSVKDGVDFHRLVASMMFNTPYAEVTREQRTYSKRITFG